jgi:hypothetical protein
MMQDAAVVRPINPTAEDVHWCRSYRQASYYRPGLGYDDYGPAYRVGYTAPLRRVGSFDQLEDSLRLDWERVKGRSRLSWSEAREAVIAAWERVSEPMTEPG